MLAETCDRAVEGQLGVVCSDAAGDFAALVQAVPSWVCHGLDHDGAGRLLVAWVWRYDVAEPISDDLVGDRVPAHHHWLVKRPLRKAVAIPAGVCGEVE
jgi:hypothetical protein